jgi:hypothetical protein
MYQPTAANASVPAYWDTPVARFGDACSGAVLANVELDCLAVRVVRAWRPSRLDGVELRER